MADGSDDEYFREDGIESSGDEGDQDGDDRRRGGGVTRTTLGGPVYAGGRSYGARAPPARYARNEDDSDGDSDDSEGDFRRRRVGGGGGGYTTGSSRYGSYDRYGGIYGGGIRYGKKQTGPEYEGEVDLDDGVRRHRGSRAGGAGGSAGDDEGESGDGGATARATGERSRLQSILAGEAEVEVEDRKLEEEEAAEGFCVECMDQPAVLHCPRCDDVYCEVCFVTLHRTGSRARHEPVPVAESPQAAAAAAAAASIASGASDGDGGQGERGGGRTGGVDIGTFSSDIGPDSPEWFLERAKHIPLRLSMKERKILRLLEGSMKVSDYTSSVDHRQFRNEAKRVVAQLKEICAILSGIVTACDYKIGQEMVESREFAENARFFQMVFEIGRRYKIMNPERMRGEYGKLIYFLQDCVTPQVVELLNFSAVVDIKTVYSYLAESEALGVLTDPNIATATMEIIANGRSRYEIQREIKTKERAIDHIAHRYQTRLISDEQIKHCLYSIADNHAFLRTSRDPCEQMIRYLRSYFRPDAVDGNFSLAISTDQGGARLTHDHTNQYHYVEQSLALWREICHEMFKLWHLAEQDLLEESNDYVLTDTGQGFHRIQQAPRISKAMHKLLLDTQGRVGQWVGSSVIHLGDKNVPNALMFIDKYTQISRILNPICTAIRLLDNVGNDEVTGDYITAKFGSVDLCKKAILCDFFTHGFDGSGADNFYDAGSCIDGRLTSAWNWCSTIEDKEFYHVFLLTGFVGFDGEWA